MTSMGNYHVSYSSTSNVSVPASARCSSCSGAVDFFMIYRIQPFPDHLPSDIIEQGQHGRRECKSSNFLPHLRADTSLAIPGMDHEIDNGLSLPNRVRKNHPTLKLTNFGGLDYPANSDN